MQEANDHVLYIVGSAFLSLSQSAACARLKRQTWVSKVESRRTAQALSKCGRPPPEEVQTQNFGVAPAQVRSGQAGWQGRAQTAPGRVARNLEWW